MDNPLTPRSNDLGLTAASKANKPIENQDAKSFFAQLQGFWVTFITMFKKVNTVEYDVDNAIVKNYYVYEDPDGNKIEGLMPIILKRLLNQFKAVVKRFKLHHQLKKMWQFK